MDDIARSLGTGRRTLARHLAREALTFTDVPEKVGMTMAQHYLEDPSLTVSRIAWLLGYQETSALTNSFRRWTGGPPTEMRTRHCCDATAAPD